MCILLLLRQMCTIVSPLAVELLAKLLSLAFMIGQRYAKMLQTTLWVSLTCTNKEMLQTEKVGTHQNNL